MNILEIILLALGLSMDSFAVSVTSGVILQRFYWLKALKIAFFLAFFQTIMPLVGWIAGIEFKCYIESCDHWIAFVLLLLLGGKMVVEALKKEEEAPMTDPSQTKTLIGLSLATSIDALAVGVSFALLTTDVWQAASIIGVTTFLCALGGIYVGGQFGKGIKSKAEILGGIILMVIGAKILLEHLYF